MNAPNSFVAGTLYWFESKEALAGMLSAAGFEVRNGHWALQLGGLARTFELAYVGNITPDTPFEVRGDGYGLPLESVAAGCARLAGWFKQNSIGFDFAHFTGNEEELAEYKFSVPRLS